MIEKDVLKKFEEVFGGGDINVYFAPGRVNMIGPTVRRERGMIRRCAFTR